MFLIFLKVNVGVLNMTSFSKSDLVGFNITKLMPKPICDYHDKILSNFVKTGGKTYTEDETEGEIRTFMLTRHKILVRVNILFKLIYNMHEGDIQLVGMIREVKSRSDSHNYLLIDEEGVSHPPIKFPLKLIKNRSLQQRLTTS